MLLNSGGDRKVWGAAVYAKRCRDKSEEKNKRESWAWRLTMRKVNTFYSDITPGFI